MKFKIISSVLLIVAIGAAVILGGGLDQGSTPTTRNDGIRINP
jgi:hypothetical protein